MKKFIETSSVLGVILGIALVIGGALGISFTYRSIAAEGVTTHADASIPNKPVRGPLTLMSQANVIRKHTLAITEGMTFAEMPQQIAKLDEAGQPVLDTDNKPVMVPNSVRDIWITSTTLTTALNLGILAYSLSGLVILIGLILIIGSVSLGILSRRTNFTS